MWHYRLRQPYNTFAKNHTFCVLQTQSKYFSVLCTICSQFWTNCHSRICWGELEIMRFQRKKRSSNNKRHFRQIKHAMEQLLNNRGQSADIWAVFNALFTKVTEIMRKRSQWEKPGFQLIGLWLRRLMYFKGFHCFSLNVTLWVADERKMSERGEQTGYERNRWRDRLWMKAMGTRLAHSSQFAHSRGSLRARFITLWEGKNLQNGI